MSAINLPPETLVSIIRATLDAHDARHPRDRSASLSLEDVAESARECEPMPMDAREMLGWAAATLGEWADRAEAMGRAGDMLADLREIAGIVGEYAGDDEGSEGDDD